MYLKNRLTLAQKNMLTAYLATLSHQQISNLPNLNNITADYFCGDEINANLCADLVMRGKKTASCSLKEAWDYDDEPYPQVGELQIVTIWQHEPVCIIQITHITFTKFCEVTSSFAKAEGEGDGSYEWWRQAHVTFFTQYANSIGCSFDEQSELVLEYFVKVYPS